MKKKIGLALGGGGARGVAHIGVLKVLEENKIPINVISGTSMGAVIGALYALEPNSKKLEEDLAKTKIDNKIFDYRFSKKGLIKGDKIRKLLDSFFNGAQFEDLKIPLRISAFDIANNREVIFSKGDVAKAVMASISLPGFFRPVENKGMVLVDGGVVDMLPVEAISKEAKKIIAVDAGTSKVKETLFNARSSDSKDNYEKSLNAWNTILRSFGAMAETIYNYQGKDSRINVLLKVGSNDKLLKFSKEENFKAIKKGEDVARANSKKLRRLRGFFRRIFS